MYRDMKGIEIGASTTRIYKCIIIQELLPGAGIRSTPPSLLFKRGFN